MRQGTIALALACAAITAPPAVGATTANLDPAMAGAGSHLLVDAQGGFHEQELPGGLALALNRGFAIDPAAVGGACSDDAAGNDQCPPNSIVGTGVLDLLAEGFAFGANGQRFTAQLTFYRAAPRRQGDLMGIVFAFEETSSGYHGTTIGRVHAIDDPVLGTQIEWDKLPCPRCPRACTSRSSGCVWISARAPRRRRSASSRRPGATVARCGATAGATPCAANA